MANTPIDQQIIEQLRNLNEHQKQQVLDFVITLKSNYSARELARLPAEEREHHIAAAFEAATKEDFEIF